MKEILYGSVCSGVEAATVAWHSLGWKPAWFCEFDKFPSAVLKHHYPHVPNLGDMTIIEKRKEYQDHAINLLVGGTPCQSFSIAGLRKGLADDRGNLALKFCEILRDKQPRWFVWENVPGVLSSNGGRDFAAILSAFRECGYGFAYRVLDAQYFGVAQRRRRLFVVGHIGDWRPAAAVLFERESLRGYNPPRRNAGEEIAGTVASSSFSGGAGGRPEGAAANHFIGIDYEHNAHSLDDATGPLLKGSPSGGGHPLPAIMTYAIQERAVSQKSSAGPQGKGWREGAAYTLEARNTTQAVAVGVAESPDLAHCLRAGASRADKHESTTCIAGPAVRRLTPVECERLQGFPDNYTLIPIGKRMAADGPRYRAMGNSMAVPVMRWIGERIALFESLDDAVTRP